MERDLDFLRCGRRLAVDQTGSLASGESGDVKSALLGKEPRYAPDRAFDSLHVRLDLDVDLHGKRLNGVCTTSIRAFVDGLRALSFDAVGMKILGVRFEGKPACFRQDGKKLTVTIPRLNSGQSADVAIRYRLEDPQVGVHFVTPGPDTRARFPQMWTQGQPEDARYWFPCHDAPQEKATSEIVARVPAGFMAVSNGSLVESRRENGGKTSFHWRLNQPHSLYLLTLCVGRFSEIQDNWKHVPLFYYCEKGREQDARRGFAKTPKAMEFFSKSIGVPYAYDRYSQICVDHFPGGMENTTATTMTDACLIDRRAALDSDVDLLVAHELAHQWFGDLLTCRDWSHAWLNEGFATYFEALFTLHDKGQDEFDYELYRNQQAYFQEDKDRYRRPIVCTTFKNPWVLFDRHLYEKGAWVLHMLRMDLGDEPWWKSIGRYVRKHRDQSVETEDLIVAIEEATGRNLRPFFDRWVFRSGYPSFKARYEWRRPSGIAELWVLQTQSVSDESPLFKGDVELRFSGRGWVREFAKTVDAKEHHWDFKLPGPPLSVEFDPRHKLLKRIDFRKPFAFWEHQMLNAESALSRLQAGHEVAKWGDAGAVASLSRALRRERFWGAASELASALAAVGTPAAFDALKPFARHRHPKVRRAAVQGLGDFRKAEYAAEVLALARRDPSIHVEAEALRTLGSLRDTRYLPLLRSKLNEESYWDVVKAGAVQGLASLREPKALPLLRRLSLPPTSKPARLYAMRALGSFASLSANVVPWLCDQLEDEDERVGLTACQALGRIEDGRALKALEGVRDKTHNIRLKTYAEEAIARIKAGSDGGKTGLSRGR